MSSRLEFPEFPELDMMILQTTINYNNQKQKDYNMNENTGKENVEANANVDTSISSLDNKSVIEQIKKLTVERKAKRDACEKAVEQLWSDYKKWREESYRPLREKLLAQLSSNHDARLAKHEARKTKAIEKAKARKEKADSNLAKLEAAEKKTAESV